MRLIDADALIEEIKSLQVFVTGLRAGRGILNEYAKQYRESLLRIVEEQPTAYDVSKVVAELEDNCDIYSVKYYQENIDVKAVPINDAIDIVRKGGIE